MMIRLIGPGGAGKSTVGEVLADLLPLPFLDLDRSFVEAHGDIDRFIASHGYHAYARANVEVYRAITNDQQDGVLALSSGFMTYPPAIYRQHADLRRDIERSTTTFVLLPSLDLETCVGETVRRQLGRPSCQRSAMREEAVIRDRFGTYLSVRAPKGRDNASGGRSRGGGTVTAVAQPGGAARGSHPILAAAALLTAFRTGYPCWHYSVGLVGDRRD